MLITLGNGKVYFVHMISPLKGSLMAGVGRLGLMLKWYS